MELSDEKLASYRVTFTGTEYRGLVMDDEQKRRRRTYMRGLLKQFDGFGDLSDYRLDRMLVYRLGGGFNVQDEEMYDFFYYGNSISRQESEFRRVRSMMPFEFMDKTGKDFDWSVYRVNVDEAKELATRYVMSFQKFRANGMGLYIYSGTKGSGKTMLSCCILNEIARRYIGSVKFINVLDFISLTKRSYDGSDETEAIYQANLLVLDDLGVQMSREWTDSVLYQLVNDRYTNRKPTIYTSNIPVGQLKIDDRIRDRIESTTYELRLPEEGIRHEMRAAVKSEILQKIKNGS